MRHVRSGGCSPRPVHVNWNDWWIGYFRGDTRHYVCLVPCVVICWKRRRYANAEHVRQYVG
jgi:hypothetical protein